MGSQHDTYRHLNKDRDGCRDGYTVGIEEYAVQLEGLNYGVHRMLSAIVRNRLDADPNDKLGNGLRDLLNKGVY
jgi:hypothetical protein